MLFRVKITTTAASHVAVRLFRTTNAHGLQDASDVPTGTRVLVDRCLLQDMTGGYRLHDLVLEYLQLTIKLDGDGLAEKATSRQARYLGRIGVFKEYADRGRHVATGGFYSLIALWNSVKKFDKTADAGTCYAESLEGVADMTTRKDVGWLLYLLVRVFLRI